ncbi:MAG: LPD23 domain-containing protein [Oscillospiraceae bacterium]|jgi:hypothetical protein|nr:hypothetical protein [Clostridiales bacterium]
MSVISKKSFLNKANKQQSNWEQTAGQEAGGVLNKQDFIRQAQSAAQQRRQAQEQKAPQRERSGFDRTATPASIAGLGAPAPTSQRQKERYNQEIGQYGVGNIDLYNRPQYRNADGSISTVDSTSFNIQGKEVLLPSVWMKDGKAYRSSDGDEILQHFYDTGEFLGVFDTVDAANSYAEKLHDAQDYYYTTQREQALDETAAHDQLQGMKRTLAILESQKKQEQAQQPGILSMLGKASDSTLPTFRADSAQSETDRRIQALQDEIDRQESESQMQGTKRPETYTAKNVGRYKDRLIALASVPGTWTKRQKQEAEEIIGTQSGFGGLLGYEQNVTAFAPYQEAMRKGDTEAAKQWQQIYDVLYTRLYSRQTAVASGLQEGLGVTSAAAAVGKALGANEDEYHRQMENAQRAQAEHPVLAGGAKIAGSLALMSGIGEAAGAGLAAAGMNTGSLGFKVAAGALSFAGADAVHNAGAAAMGDMSTEDYLKRIAISGAQGMAGNLAGGLVGTGLANVLRDTHMMTPFMEFLRQTASGVTNASVNQAVGYLAADEKPTKEEIATNLVTAFAFSVLSSAISSYQTTQQQKAQMNQAYQAIEQGYRAMTAGTENMTPEAKAQRAQFIMQQTQSLRESVNSYYIAGQQKAVDNLNETLDLIDEAMRAYVNGYAAASSAMQTPNVMLPGGGSTGQLPTAADLPTTPTDPQMQKQVEQELQTAIQQGLQQGQAGTQNTQPPESGQALQNGNAAAAAAQIAVQAAEQNQQAQQPSLPTAAQAAAVQPQQLEQSTQQEAGLLTPQQVQTEQTATPLERLETMGVSGKRAQSMARGIEAFYRGQITDGEVLSKLLSFPEVQNVMRQMTDADIEAVVSGNVQAQNQQPVNTAAQQVPGSQQPGVQNEATTHEGGMNNGTEQLPAGQQPGTEQQSEQLPDGDGGRILGESTGGQSGILAEGRPQRTFNQGRTAVERENLGRTLRLEKVSSQSLGLPNGTEEREIQVMPESHWDAQMQQTAQRISYETGKPVTYVLGSIRIRQADGSVSAARGVYTENGIIIQADHRYLNIDQIADHEAFHDYAANNPGLVRQIERAIVEQYSREEFDAIMDKYLKNLRGVYDLPEHASGQEVAEAYGIVKEEICADAYAGINFFGAHAEKYRSEAQAVLQERKVTTPGSETAAATQRRTGPPERYSYGGVNANTADQKTLAHAQELQMQGEDDERVRKETGWHTGMEGKLRFEIDDSKMKYHRGGDAAFSRSHPDYAEYQKLVDKMLTGSAEAWKPEDQERLQELDKTWGREYGRLSERVESGNATLEDVIDHEELFQAYPQLRNVRVEFKELPGNTQGYFSPSENKIALDSKLRSAPEATIIHEIQHAIQKAEGFASGASPEYWQQHRDEAKEARIADIREEIARLEEQLPWDLNRWTAEDDAIEAKIGELEDSIIDIQNGVGMDSYDLYRNTAGEIEARDAASRRELTPEQRRAAPPARADENTVYADLSDSLDYVGKTDDGTEVYETSEAVRKLPYKKRMEAFMDIMRNEYAGRTAKFTARDGEVYYATFDENDLRKNVYGDKKSSPRGWKAKINTGADGNIFDLVENAEHGGSGKEQGKTSEAHQGLTGWEYFVKTVQIDGRVYDLLANVRKKPDGEFVYSIQLNENEKKAPAPPRQYQNGTAKAENRPVRVPTDASEASVAEKRLPVKAWFSLDEPVEQTQDLMAIHNLDGKKMDSMLQLGAIPSPSVAIVKASQGHTQYGDYTLVFPRQSIDPQADRRNKVYGADAWTPTAANAIVEREVNYEAGRAAEQKIAQLANQVAGGIFSRYSVISGRVGEVARMDEAELAKQLARDDAVRAAYLAEQGKDIEPVLKEKVWDSFGNLALQEYTEKIGAQELAQLYVKLETGERLTAAELETARESIMASWIADHEYALSRRPELRETRTARQRDKISDARVEDFIRNAEALYEDGGQTRDGVDRYATQDKLREAVDDADVEAWVRGQIRGVLGEPGIYNGKERFTASGKRRSFRETHGAYTAENIVKAMNRASARGESYWGVGAKGILSVATPRYKSVDAIHADEGRLQNMPEEEYNRLLQELDKRIGGIVADVQKTAGSYDMDEIAGLLMENAGQDAMRIQQAFSRQGYDIDGGLATEIAGMYRQAAEMPTGYFEAKPQRVVTFDEPVCIAPDDCPPERLEKMKAAGLNVIEYEAGNDEQRMEIARSLKGMRFSVDEPQAETGGEIEQASESKPAEPEQKEKKPRKKNETKPVAESLPIIAKRNLRQDMQGIFSIPEGRRAEINQIIDGLADRMLKNGELTQEDRDAFFDRMYAEGVMEVAADEYLQQARSEIAGRRIYVPESVKHEFGDDWGYFRKKAFAAGVMLVNDTSAAGIDMVNAELADTLPGMFHADDLDSREILENIVQTAEEGKSQNMSLAQYTALLAGQEYVSEDEVLDNIERQMDEALRTFTRTAKLEVHLRDRTGVKIAQEREKSAAARQREALSRAKERQQRKEMSQRQREYRELKEQQKKTLKALQWLAKNQYRAPEELQGTWDEVLGDLDIYAVSAANEMRYSKKYDATWKDLAEMYKDAQENDPNFLPSKELEKIVHRLDNKKIADMDLNALQDLYKAAVGLRTEFYNRNNVINDDMNRLFAEVYTDSKKELDFGAQTKAGEAARQGKKLDSLFNQEQLSPMNVMQRMAGWNPNSAWYSMAKQLEKGERDIRDYTVSATKQLREFLTEHEDWAKKADGQGDDGIWYEVKIPQLVGALEVGKPPKFGDTITVWMTPTQKVHMYLESKSTENLRHMEGGRTFADKTLYSQGKRRKAFAQGKTVRMAPETVKAIVGSLTPEEQELAQALEQYYNVFAKKEINRVSNILYGYDKAVSKNYTPIYTNSNYTKSELGVYDATAEGVGNLKSRQFSKNPSYNIGAFDAFERHVEQTARFVGMAIPARNWQTLLNWSERENSMADIITHDWGDESLKYIQDLVQTLQGGAASTRDSVSMGAEKVFSNYIGAVFGANPSIVFKQLGSIPLAGAWLDFKNFPSPGQVKRIDRSLIEKYTQELDWRTLGYSTPETKQLKENPNWTQTNKFTNFIFGGGAITAMDGWAASVLWPWAENKVRAEFPELETGSQEQIDSGSSPFYQKVAEVFNEAVARSQSTSDEMHQGTLRKSKNPVTRAFTMFKSDSSQTYNALRQRAGEAEYYKRIGDTENYNKAKRGLGVAFLAAVGGYIWAQGIEFLMNLWKRKGKAYRDEDGNLTAGSVAKEMALGLVGDLAGIVTYGEELADVIGNIITGDKWYGIDTPGLEQLSDVVETIVEQGQNGLDVLRDAADVVKNGGSLGEYLHRHSGDIVGGIKDLAAAAATYLPGISVNNLEAYLLGTVRWASPELAAAYDDALATANKNQMKGLRGAELERKISDTLHNRRVETDETTNETLASLYESGFTKAVPSDTPGSISVDGEDRKLSAYQKQVYDKTWSGAVGSRLQELIASDVFQAADDETREKMLSGLYEYAGEKAKAAVFDDYEVKTSTQKADDVLATGAEMADYLELKLAGAVDKYLDAIDGGLDAQSAKDVALGMAELAPEEGKKTVSDVQKWRAAIDAVDGTSAQRDALLAVMKDSTKQKYEIADSYGIEARTWVQLKEILPQFDEDGNGSYKGEEIENAIDALNGHSGIMLPGGDGPQQLTNEMRAVLWQLFTGSKSAKNNPYSERVGSQVIAEREKAKQED